MGTFSTTSPATLQLADWEARDRAAAIAATGSPSPVPFTPIDKAPPIYTHVGHDAQYGRGRRNGRTVRLIILHTTEGDSFTGSLSYGARRPDTVSATCYAGGNGELGYTVPEADRPFTTGRWNDESLTVEICGRAAWTASEWRARPRQLEALTRLLVDWCTRYRIPAVFLTADQVAAGASKQSTTPVQGTARGITDHLEANLAARQLGASIASTTHHDIGPGLRSIVVDDIIPEVARRLAGTTTPPPAPAIVWAPPMKALHMPTAELRLVDTRAGVGLARPVADSTFELELPADHDPHAAVVHVTIVRPTGDGFLALGGDNPADTSKLNYSPADPSPPANTTLVAVGRNGAGRPVIRGVLRHHTAELIVDLVGVIS